MARRVMGSNAKKPQGKKKEKHDTGIGFTWAGECVPVHFLSSDKSDMDKSCPEAPPARTEEENEKGDAKSTEDVLSHTILLGSTGSGKTGSIVYPDMKRHGLENSQRARHSMLLRDLKGVKK